MCLVERNGLLLCLLVYACMAFQALAIWECTLKVWFTDRGQPPWLPPVSDNGLILGGLQALFLALAFVAHIGAACADAGYIPKDVVPPPHLAGKTRACQKCGVAWKPARAHHCRVCKRCVFRMDHHCPWVNNCVGLGNQKYFMLFMIYIAVACIITLFIHCLGGYYWLMSYEPGWLPPQNTVFWLPTGFWCVVAVCKAIFFLFFVTDFLGDQFEALHQNSTLVETFQHTHGRRVSFWHHVREVMGPTWILWVLPVPPGIAFDYEEPAIPDEDYASYSAGPSEEWQVLSSDAASRVVKEELRERKPERPLVTRE